jgi:PAS domain-containing protein
MRIFKWNNNRKLYNKAKREIPQTLKSINDRLSRVETELRPNGGGSMKDTINIMKAEMDANNWLSPRPTFRCMSNGMNTFVNEAYCHLCGVSSSDIMALGWMGYAQDAEQMDDYYDRFLQSTKNYSQFTGRLKIQSKNGDYRGEWTVRIRPLGPIITKDGEDFLWHGALWPHDQKAKEYASMAGIPLI